MYIPTRTMALFCNVVRTSQIIYRNATTIGITINPTRYIVSAEDIKELGDGLQSLGEEILMHEIQTECEK